MGDFYTVGKYHEKGSQAFNKEALAILKADGAERKDIYSGKEVDAAYLGDKAASMAAVGAAAEGRAAGRLTKADQIKAGEALFAGTCSVCHQPSGAGLANVFPPLAKSDFLMADKRQVHCINQLDSNRSALRKIGV